VYIMENENLVTTDDHIAVYCAAIAWAAEMFYQLSILRLSRSDMLSYVHQASP